MLKIHQCKLYDKLQELLFERDPCNNKQNTVNNTMQLLVFCILSDSEYHVLKNKTYLQHNNPEIIPSVTNRLLPVSIFMLNVSKCCVHPGWRFTSVSNVTEFCSSIATD